MKEVQLSKESFANYRYFEPDDTASSGQARGANTSRNFVTYLTLFESDLYCINDLNCYYDSRHIFKPTITGRFSMNFTRKGYFTFATYKRLEEEFASRIMLEKPGCEFRFVQQLPGEGACTVFSFAAEAYHLIQERYSLKETGFFSNPDMFSIIIAASAEADLIHHQILKCLSQGRISSFEVDCLVAELVEVVVSLLVGLKKLQEVPYNTKRIHLQTIERAKEYLIENLSKNITLKELARECYVSQFHFTRLFKDFCGYSPFVYLQKIRLKHAEALITSTELPITDICFRSGFNRLDYFSTAFSKQYGASPTRYKINARPARVFFEKPRQIA
jgi:AraC-like DNA-binding protein